MQPTGNDPASGRRRSDAEGPTRRLDQRLTRLGPFARCRQPRATATIGAMKRKQWLVPAGLVLLGLIPIVVAVLRAFELLSGPEVTPDNARFVASPLPILAHVIGGPLYLVLGALQFVPALRRRGRPWHRVSGRVTLVSGLAVAGAGLWMTLFEELPAYDGPLLNVIRVIVSTVMLSALLLAFAAIRRRDIPTHRAWMIRAYALGIGAGTQAFVFIPWELVVGEPDVTTRALLMGFAWALNAGVAEWVIRRTRTRRRASVPSERVAVAG